MPSSSSTHSVKDPPFVTPVTEAAENLEVPVTQPAAEPQLWNKNEVPDKEHPELEALIYREPQDAARAERAAHIFRPKAQHCGIWQDAPNPRCHASFGDKATTASASCMGNMVQMSRFLGAGHSGVFTIDHTSVSEPYAIWSRADDLDDLARNEINPEIYTFGLQLPKEFCPKEPPLAQWVNWRWPRYEWETKVSDVDMRVVIQWVVHGDIVLQQVVLENLGEIPVQGFSFKPRKEMLIRDVDYLDSSYAFNESEKDGYFQIPAPHGLGWVIQHVLDTPRSEEKPAEDTEDGPQNEDQHNTPLTKSTMPDPSSIQGSTSSNPGVSDSRPKGAPGVVTTVSQSYPNEQFNRDIEQSPAVIAHDTEAPNSSEDKGNQPKCLKDTWSAGSAHSVASVMALYHDGVAVRIAPEHENYDVNIESRGTGANVHELVMAYKLVVLPDAKVHWRNFLITAEQSDVSKILREETERLWGDCLDSDMPLCKLGLSMIVGDDSTQATADPRDIGKGKPDGHDTVSTDVQQVRVVFDETTETFTSKNTTEADPLGSQKSLGPSDPADSKGESRLTRSLGTPKGLPGKSSPRDQIEYMSWRHLEHILSVCAVPLMTFTLFEDEISPNLGNPDDEPIVALTCGDMSGHRICTSASFFAFQFLVDVWCRLRKMRQSSYLSSLRHRIECVCRGHIRWLEWLRKQWSHPEDVRSLLKSGCFAANYWLNGDIMTRDSRSWQPQDAITDTPFQILKLASYNKLLDEESQEMQDVLGLMRDVWVPWIHEIDGLDRRGVFAWPHTQDDGINTYRLDDHVWLWRSLTEMDSFGLRDYQPLTKPSGPYSDVGWNGKEDRWIRHIYDLDKTPGDDSSLRPVFEKFSRIVKRLLPIDVQRGVLQRFTTENEVSRKRMLAVTRSPRETRFLLHARDTALFYGHERGFFLPGTSFTELWQNTVEAQLDHEENLEESWDNVLRFALGVVAGTQGSCLNQRSAVELAQNSVEVLIRSSAHNGFIPGELDAANKTPSLYAGEEDRDYYYCVGFEASHILLSHARAIDETFMNSPLPRSVHGILSQPQTYPEDRQAEHPPRFPPEMIHVIKQEVAAQLSRQKLGTGQSGSDLDVILRRLETSGRREGQRSLAVKKAIPFNNSMIDANSITSIDEEWLYNYPAFLLVGKVALDEQLAMFFKIDSDEYISDPVGTVIDRTLEKYKNMPKPVPGYWSEGDSPDVVAFVASTPKQKRLSKQQKRRQDDPPYAPRLDNSQLWDEIGAARSAANAKKRFVWLPHAVEKTAFLCWVASSKDERPAMSLFFDRHAKFEKHLWDDTTMVLNTWETELHLSFYVLVDDTEPKHVGLPPLTKDAFPGNSKKEMRRASMGFRFDGDFFDRYWTCHFIQYIPSLHDSADYNKVSPQGEWDFDFHHEGLGRYKEKHWWQRKVLELHLLHRMLRAVVTGCAEILGQVKAELGVGESSLSISGILNSEAYASSKDNWQKFEHILQAVDEDLTAVLGTLQKWDAREAARGQERPRWTRTDERKYRGHINKFRARTDRQAWDLEARRDAVRKLRETLTTSREKIRADLEVKREQNIRYFTYVTVVFLPLGFAASFYSMSGAPEHALVVSLVEFAAGAFAVTIALLFCAKGVFATTDVVLGPLRRVARGAVQRLEQYFRAKRRESLLVREDVDLYGQATVYVKKTTETSDNAPKLGSRRRANMPETGTPTRWFWLAYFLLEVPACRVSLAVTALKVGAFSPGAAGKVFVGIVFLPIYGVSRVLQILAVNFLSLIRISDHIRTLYLSSETKPKSSDKTRDEAFSRHFQQMVQPPSTLGPLGALENQLQELSFARREKKRADEVTNEKLEKAEGV